MNLIYHSSLTDELLTLDDELYKALFSSQQGFQAKQLKCRGQGDDCDLFEVTRKANGG